MTACSGKAGDESPDGDIDVESDIADADPDWTDRDVWERMESGGDGDMREASELDEEWLDEMERESDPDGDSAEHEKDIERPARLFSVKDGAMITADGHRLFLRGINISGEAKTTEDYLFDLTQKDIETLLDGGISVVRLLTFWRAVSPDGPGIIDRDYLSAFRQRVTDLTEAGMYVFLDMHQDLWGHPFSSHGAPEWACPDDIKEGYEASSPWWINYGKSQVKGCFENFFNDPALIEAYAQSWKAVAEETCSDKKVLGYDLMNEPFSGNILGDSVFDKEVLLPFYLQVADAIEEVCPGRLFFLEPSFGVLPLEAMEIPRKYKDRVVIAPHYYPSEVHEVSEIGYQGDAESLEIRVLDLLGAYVEKNQALLLGEFGGMSTNPNFDLYMRDIHTILVKHFISSTLWDYSSYDGGFAFLDSQGSLKPVFESVYRAPLPIVLPSQPSHFLCNWAEGKMNVSFDCRLGRRLTVQLPDPQSTCTIEPPGAMENIVGTGFVESDCMQDVQVTIDCER